jgi:hypothetical protein
MRFEISKTIQVFAVGLNWGINYRDGKEENKEYRLSIIVGFLIFSFYVDEI